MPNDISFTPVADLELRRTAHWRLSSTLDSAPYAGSCLSTGATPSGTRQRMVTSAVRRLMVMRDMPETRYAKAVDGVHIAYQVFGGGPIDLVIVPGFISHLEVVWEDPASARMLRRIAAIARVITFDKRGTGLSDRTDQLPDIDQRMLDVQAVIDEVGSERPSILGISEGGAMAIVYAAIYPERVRSLVLYGAFAMPVMTDDHPIGTPLAGCGKTLRRCSRSLVARDRPRVCEGSPNSSCRCSRR